MDKKQLQEVQKSYNENLAKSLGYASFKDMKKTMNKDSLSGGVKSRLEQGGGIVESVVGGTQSNLQSLKSSLNPKTVAKKFYNEIFAGDDFLSAYMRGRIVNKPGDSPTASKLSPSSPTASLGEEGLISGIANDVSTIRNAISSLLSFERENKEQSKDRDGDSFFKQQDEREAKLEGGSPTQISVEGGTSEAGEDNDDGGGGLLGFLGKIVKFLVIAFTTIFAVGTLAAMLPAAAIAGLFIGIFKGLMAGFDKYKESGDLSAAITTGLGTMLDFITFGLFGEDSLKNMLSSIGDFTKPIIEKIGSVFTGIMDWVKNNVGIPKITFGESTAAKAFGGPWTIGPYYPFKDDPSNPDDEVSTPKPDPEPSAHEKLKAEIMASEELKPDTEALKGFGNTADGVSHLVKGQKVPEAELIRGFSNTPDNSPEAELIRGFSNTPNNSPIGMVGVDNSADGSSTFGNSAAPTAHKFGTTEEEDKAAMGNFLQGGGLDSAMGNLSSGTTAVPGAMDNAASTIADKINAGGVTPSAVTPFGSASSGAVVESSSVEVDSGQRQESMGSGGSIINSPTTTNNSGSTGSNKTPPADVMNFDFADMLQRT